jgi:hypothetical protein
MTETLVHVWENNEILQLRAQLRSKTYECSVWKKRCFQLGQEVRAAARRLPLLLLSLMLDYLNQNAKLRSIFHQALSPLDPIKDLAMVVFSSPQNCPVV